jgi:prepilin-type N-terminal cleavage/methylation domain-containing protein
MKKNLKAFTLIELLIVIIIIGIIISSVSFNLKPNTLALEKDRIKHYFMYANNIGLKWDGYDPLKPEVAAVCFEVNGSNNSISAYIQKWDNSEEFLKDPTNQNKEINNTKFQSNITATFTKICFSTNGDLFENNLSMQNLIKTPQKITLSDGKREENLTIEPSGAIH